MSDHDYGLPARLVPIHRDPDYSDELQDIASRNETMGDTADYGPSPLGPGLIQGYGPVQSPWPAMHNMTDINESFGRES